MMFITRGSLQEEHIWIVLNPKALMAISTLETWEGKVDDSKNWF
jgi:hypothetical protein